MIRIATKNDVPTLVEWMLNLVLHVQVSSSDPYVLALEEGYENKFAPWFIKTMDSENSVVYMAEDNNIPVGFVFGKITEPFMSLSKIKAIGQIELCWVETRYRKQGIATKLVRELESWFKKKNIEYVDLQYLVGNVEAENSWVHLGYKPYRIAARKKI